MSQDYGSCDICKKGRFELKENKEIAGSKYKILVCNKCRHNIARRDE